MLQLQQPELFLSEEMQSMQGTDSLAKLRAHSVLLQLLPTRRVCASWEGELSCLKGTFLWMPCFDPKNVKQGSSKNRRAETRGVLGRNSVTCWVKRIVTECQSTCETLQQTWKVNPRSIFIINEEQKPRIVRGWWTLGQYWLEIFGLAVVGWSEGKKRRWGNTGVNGRNGKDNSKDYPLSLLILVCYRWVFYGHLFMVMMIYFYACF